MGTFVFFRHAWLMACRKNTNVPIFVLSLLLAGCASVLDEDEAVAVVPYRIGDSGHIIIDVKINDEGPFDFAIDSAATITAVFDGLRKAIDLEQAPQRQAKIHGMVASGTFPLISLDSLQVGSERWADARVVALPSDSPVSAAIDGILGVDFLRRYAVGFSTDDRVLRLYPPELVAARRYTGWAAVPLRPLRVGKTNAELLAFDMEVDGMSVRAVFDLGAGLNLINWRGARSIGARLRTPREDREVKGAVDTETVTARLKANQIRAGKVTWRDVEFLIADLGVFSIFQLENEPVAIVGSELFNRRDFVIDFTRNRLLIRTQPHQGAR